VTARRRIGKYEILEEIERVGFAVVSKARDTKLDRGGTLKAPYPQLTTDPEFIHRFHQEARTAVGVCHPHVVTTYDLGEQAGQQYQVMSFVPAARPHSSDRPRSLHPPCVSPKKRPRSRPSGVVRVTRS
jgi:serine/threonine protein kinase